MYTRIQKGWKRQSESVPTSQEPIALSHTRGRHVMMAFIYASFFALENDAKMAFSGDFSISESKSRD